MLISRNVTIVTRKSTYEKNRKDAGDAELHFTVPKNVNRMIGRDIKRCAKKSKTEKKLQSSFLKIITFRRPFSNYG